MARDAFRFTEIHSAARTRPKSIEAMVAVTVRRSQGDRLIMKGWAVRERRKPAPFCSLADAAPDRWRFHTRGVFYGRLDAVAYPSRLSNCGFTVDLEPDLPSGRLEISAWATDPEQNKAARRRWQRRVSLISRLIRHIDKPCREICCGRSPRQLWPMFELLGTDPRCKARRGRLTTGAWRDRDISLHASRDPG